MTKPTRGELIARIDLLQSRIDRLINETAGYSPVFCRDEDRCGVHCQLPDGRLIPCPLHFAHPGPHGDDFVRYWRRSSEDPPPQAASISPEDRR
jgi:hypothetical protein